MLDPRSDATKHRYYVKDGEQKREDELVERITMKIWTVVTIFDGKECAASWHDTLEEANKECDRIARTVNDVVVFVTQSRHDRITDTLMEK